ncbi:MAG: PilZ domain-containing protein [Candidatus Omnitrophota bacterium]
MKEKSGSERRRFKRVDVSFWVESAMNAALTVHMIFGGNDIKATTLDLSEGGMAILSEFEIPTFSIVTVEFNIPNNIDAASGDEYRLIKADGVVKYCFSLKERNAYRIGICFIDIIPEDLDFIANFVKTHPEIK